MTDKYKGAGDVLDYVNASGSDIAAGDVIVSGDAVFVAKDAIANGETGAVWANNAIVEIPAEGDTAWVQGDQIYWDAYLGEGTKTASSYNRAGIAAKAKAAAARVGEVVLGFNPA